MSRDSYSRNGHALRSTPSVRNKGGSSRVESSDGPVEQTARHAPQGENRVARTLRRQGERGWNAWDWSASRDGKERLHTLHVYSHPRRTPNTCPCEDANCSASSSDAESPPSVSASGEAGWQSRQMSSPHVGQCHRCRPVRPAHREQSQGAAGQHSSAGTDESNPSSSHQLQRCPLLHRGCSLRCRGTMRGWCRRWRC
jgi:hypothetical protein